MTKHKHPIIQWRWRQCTTFRCAAVWTRRNGDGDRPNSHSIGRPTSTILRRHIQRPGAQHPNEILGMNNIDVIPSYNCSTNPSYCYCSTISLLLFNNLIVIVQPFPYYCSTICFCKYVHCIYYFPSFLPLLFSFLYE
jgi:hypothetical protein